MLQLDILNSKNENYQKIRFEIENLFNIMNSNLNKKTTFFVLSIYNVIEALIQEFGFHWGKTYLNITKICFDYGLEELNPKLSQIICTRNYLVHLENFVEHPACAKNILKAPQPDDLVDWLNVIFKILSKINDKTL